MSELRVLHQSSIYKYEYESSLHEMYDAHQFELRIRKLNTEIQTSQNKAKLLEEELNKFNKSWNLHYDDAVR